MSSYLGGFPPRVPRSIMESYVPARTIVLDPFCGAGTTLVEARLSGRPTIGIDKNPLAVALSRAKMASVDFDQVCARLDELAFDFPGEIALDPDSDNIRIIFHSRTLAQLCYLRDALDPDRDIDAFLIGAILGIMHGKMRKDGGTAYLSIDMPNTFSMSPEYVRRFVQKHELARPPIDVFHQLRQRAKWLLRSGSLPNQPAATVIEGDATDLPRLLRTAGFRTVGAVVTSPPYLGILRYGAFNWIRLWFLRQTQQQVDRLLDGTDSMDVYLSFMATFFDSLSKVTRPGAVVAMVIGDVVENGQHVPLADRLWEELGDMFPFELVANIEDGYDNHTKTTRIWGKDRKGKATPKDHVLVMGRVRKPNS
ncbi:MAG: DNA methyltransferase [Thermoanaerobaculia bacterium]|nr:DNA methyltransferase [Thermoanaerobaculia bacterium]